MEYVFSPVILVLVLRFGIPALITWFFESFVEPKAELAKQKNNSKAPTVTEPTNSQRIATTRKSLSELGSRIEQPKR